MLNGRAIEVVTADGTFRGVGRGLGRDGELIVEQDQGEVQSILSAERVLFR